MNILDKIVEQKKKEIISAKQLKTISDLEKSSYFHRPTISLKNKLQQNHPNGIIAEYKRKSPSKGIINDTSPILDVVTSYENCGVAACSILTDTLFFGGSLDDLFLARKSLSLPILRKDFMIDEYQFYEAKAMGADIVLLIASILTPSQVKEFTDLATSLHLEVLLELHDESELNHVCSDVQMVGINNRNLKTFEVDVEQSVRMCAHLGNDFIKIAESGISSVETVRFFKQNGFSGFLIGENFMKTAQPGRACHEFVEQL